MSAKPQDSASSNTGHRSGQSESARESKRTWAFVIAAIGCLLVTGLFEWMGRPATIEEYGKIGQEFYPDFTDPTTATSLTVSVIDPEEVKPLEFSVKQAENGQWVIPSHHNYPADAADQLAKTASSIIGIKRGAMVSRWASDHTRYGVVDPQTDSVGVDELEGIGKRITLGGKDESILASYIVGKKVDGENNQYYVRHPNEDETYIAELDINLTTRFGDWVNTDLLDITNSDVRRIELNDYSFDELRGTITGNVQSVVSRESSTDEWKLAGIDETSQEVKESAVTDTLNTLANLEIVGVRPKQPGLTADLQIDREALKSQRDLDRLTSDLLARGFLLQPNRENQNLLELIAREGEMFVGTEEGLLYRLYFGRAFTGSEEELEIGLTSTDSEQEAEKESTEKDGEAEAAGEDADASTDSDSAEGDSEEKSEKSGKPGRYVFVRVNFDPTLLGEVPTKPEEPQEPAEIKELEEKIKQSEASGGAESKEAEGESDEAAADDSQDGEATEAESAEETDQQKLQRLREEFAAAKTEYETKLADFEDYQQKIEEGKQKSEELNRRFARWYYVIPGDSYDKLSLDREDLIQDKESENEAADAEGQAGDGVPPVLGGLSEAIMKEAAEAPAQTDAPASDAPAADDSPEAAAAEDPATKDPATKDPAAKDPAGDQPEASDKSDAATGGEAEAPAESPQTPPSEEPAPDSDQEGETPDPSPAPPENDEAEDPAPAEPADDEGANGTPSDGEEAGEEASDGESEPSDSQDN